ncbi:Uncharacterized protein PECH_002381 [Penicillium ucsense]|uniref:Transmembrane protein n=1 Tax=Penicillium ucsense TaxID=2839758 RepID=A0A8J8W703_9EURO|nr:Uncharacterized protein PECM_003011 [Penicillium ucsense]KAF7737919.1 Uncharacterized protein PECH_002381 [Penicillium ucsense]
MSSYYSSSNIPTQSGSGCRNEQGVFSAHLVIPIYATIWLISWLLGVLLEISIFIGSCLAQGKSPSRGSVAISLDMPVFALFCIGLWGAIKLSMWFLVVLCSLFTMVSDADEENARAARQRREQVLRRRAMRQVHYH